MFPTPTDLDLLYDFVRTLIQQTSRHGKKRPLPGRASVQLSAEKIQKLFYAVRSSRLSNLQSDKVKTYSKIGDVILIRAAHF